MSLEGLSKDFQTIPGVLQTHPNEADVVKELERKEQEEHISQEQKEILNLMTANREHSQYKKALNQTIAGIRSGKLYVGKTKDKEDK